MFTIVADSLWEHVQVNHMDTSFFQPFHGNRSKTHASSSATAAAAYTSKPLQQQDDNDIKKKVLMKADETVTLENDGFHFREGALVEVCSDEKGLRGVWFYFILPPSLVIRPF
ncbi:hypothetical protein MtrunA17_Chr6g0474131 [Medicago truncatula]|uniref:Agenet-like domain-containing protein n=1 Tax=Medicago truncatula TaxID=3880 RepID=A0A396HF51_MEDTR|nr:hypothetical protein MtrunA17_Chr6g0474131 [Medicago truncatula]